MVHHGEFLRAACKDDLLVYHLERDWRQASLDAADVAMLNFVEKLNGKPGQVLQEDIDALRAAGFDDRNVLDIVMICAAYNFMNRLADGVGLPAEEGYLRIRARRDKQVEEELGIAIPAE